MDDDRPCLILRVFWTKYETLEKHLFRSIRFLERYLIVSNKTRQRIFINLFATKSTLSLLPQKSLPHSNIFHFKPEFIRINKNIIWSKNSLVFFKRNYWRLHLKGSGGFRLHSVNRESVSSFVYIRFYLWDN